MSNWWENDPIVEPPVVVPPAPSTDPNAPRIKKPAPEQPAPNWWENDPIVQETDVAAEPEKSVAGTLRDAVERDIRDTVDAIGEGRPVRAVGDAIERFGKGVVTGAKGMAEGLTDSLLAGQQGVNPTVRDFEGNPNYRKLGDAIETDGGWGRVDRGRFVPIRGETEVILRDPETGKFAVYERNEKMAESRVPGLGRVLGYGMLAGPATPRPYPGMADSVPTITGAVAAAGRKALPYVAGAGSKAAQERLAADVLTAGATDAAALRESLKGGPSEIVPGSRPTTYQQSGDPGIGQLERAQETLNPAPFLDRRAEQNAARITSLRNLEQGGDPAEVYRFTRQVFDDINREAETAIASATAAGRAEVAAATAAGERAVGEAEAARGAVDAQTGQRVAEAEQRALAAEGTGAVDKARRAADAEGAKVGGAGTPEQYGAEIRAPAVEAEAAARAREGKLWAAVDPDGTLALDASPMAKAAAEVAAEITPSAKPMGGEEKAIFDLIGERYGGVLPFREVTDLRGRISAALRDELSSNGRTPTYARLSRLRGAIEDTIATAMERQATLDAQAVARGEMAADETLAALVQGWANAWRQAGAANREGLSATGTARTAVVPSVSGGSRSAGSQPGGAPGNQGLPGDAGGGSLRPNFDDAARERLTAASDATKERATTFNKGPVGDITRKGEQSDTFRLSDAAVAPRIFKPGPAGFESVTAYRNAVGDERALPVLQDYAAMSLRREAVRPDGTFNPDKIRTWFKRHQDAVRAVPGLAERFDGLLKAEDAVTAAEQARKDAIAATKRDLNLSMNERRARIREANAAVTQAERQRNTAVADAERAAADLVDQAARTNREAMRQFKSTEAAKFLKAENPADVPNVVGGILGQRDAATAMANLRKQVGDNKNAVDGVRRAVADYMLQRFLSNTEAATSGQAQIRADQLQTFIRRATPALRSFFSRDEIEAMDAVMRDLQRANRSLSSNRLPARSNTAQDILAAGKAAGNETLLSRLIAQVVATGTAGATLGGGGAIGGYLGARALASLRDSGIAKVSDLVTQALLDPSVAAALLTRTAPKSAKVAEERLSRALQRYVVVTERQLTGQGSGERR